MPAVRFAYAECALVAALLACGALRLDRPVTLAVLCVVTVAASTRLSQGYAVALGLVAWACFTGFAVNEYGVLTFTGPDLTRLALLVAVGATAHWTR